MTRIYLSDEEAPCIYGVYDPEENALYINLAAEPNGIILLLQKSQLLLVV